MAWFTGTSTGRTYEVGKQYVSAGDVYTANSNGTFTNERSGRTSVGSSQSPTALFGGYQSLSSPLPGLWSRDPDWRGSGGSGPGNGSTQSGPGYAGSGPGVGVAGGGGSGPGGARVVHSRSAGSQLALTSKANPTTRMAWSGEELNLDHTTSDGGEGEQRWGEWGGGIYGLGVAFNDILHASSVDTDKLWHDVGTNGDPSKWAPDLASGIIDFAGYLGERKAAIRQREVDFAHAAAEAEHERQWRSEAGKQPMWNDPVKVYRQLGMYP